MKFRKIIAAGLCLSMLAGCGAVKPVKSDKDSITSVSKEEDGPSGMQVTPSENSISGNLGVSLAEMNVLMNQKAIPLQGHPGHYAYPVLLDQRHGYTYGVLVVVDDEDLLTNFVVAFEGPQDDEEFRSYSLDEALRLFNRMPDIDITTFGDLSSRLDFVSDNEANAVGIYGSYATKMAMVFEEDDSLLISMEMIPWTVDRAAGDPTAAEVDRESTFDVSNQELFELLEDGQTE